MNQQRIKERKFVCFLLGLVIGNKILPWFMHLIYLAIIGYLIAWKFI